MAAPKFIHHNLRLVDPKYGSALTTTIIELEKLRTKTLGGEVHPAVFFQLKEIFHLLESLGSARIEGNNTTLSEIVEKRISGETNSSDESMLEIQNMERAMEFVTENVDQLTKIDHAFIRELHKMVVQNLTREGDRTPGSYRNFDVTINNSSHKPPTHVKVSEYMDELIGFINTPVEKQYELITGAIAHHRFTWVHPFGNGNGRVVRLLTYSMLVKQGFRVSRGRILNPSAIFCIDREKYYSMLAKADTGTDSGILEWVEYVLVGMLAEINKIDNLLDREYLTNKILKPAIELCLRVKSITSLQASILNMAATKMSISAVDLHSIMPDKLPAARSREIKRLKEQEMLMPVTAEGLPAENARFYVIDFANSYLLRGVIRALRDEKFLGVQELEKRSI